MELAQYYDTTIVDCESNRAIRAIVVPARSIAPADRGDLLDWIQLFDIEAIGFVQSEAEALSALAGLLRSDDSEALALARTVMSTSTIPFEVDGFRVMSLLEVAGTAGVALGSVLALVRLESLPFLFVAVPDGIVLCGNALDVSDILGRGVEVKLRRLMGLDGSRMTQGGASPLPQREA
ncbi:MAG TPA: hypothetical protein VFK32_06770 [Tepidiformaceae bacterium]|nr:hypothetical protein [Tepidiformaceae bacterium]